MFVPVKDESSLRAKSSESRSEFRYVSIKRNSSMIEQRVVSPNNYLSKLNLQVNHSKDVPPLILEERICSYGRGGDLSIALLERKRKGWQLERILKLSSWQVQTRMIKRGSSSRGSKMDAIGGRGKYSWIEFSRSGNERKEEKRN